jgi:hypothetical protein
MAAISFTCDRFGSMFAALILLAAVAQPLIGILFAFLAPVWFFLALIASATIPIAHEPIFTSTCPDVPAFSPRPPPIQ